MDIVAVVASSIKYSSVELFKASIKLSFVTVPFAIAAASIIFNLMSSSFYNDSINLLSEYKGILIFVLIIIISK